MFKKVMAMITILLISSMMVIGIMAENKTEETGINVRSAMNLREDKMIWALNGNAVKNTIHRVVLSETFRHQHHISEMKFEYWDETLRMIVIFDDGCSSSCPVKI